QPAGDLGYKMKQAFETAFQQEYNAVVIIGSDCLELNQQLIERAFDALEKHEVVIGPAKEGGYYLLGMKQLHASLFENKAWSTSEVFPSTLADIKREALT